MEYITESQKELPVIGEYDVLVLGGGPAGVSAAVSASRAGAKTALVERYGYLGGQATGGLVILIVGLTDGRQRIIKGFCEETINRLDDLGATKNVGPHVLFDPESMKFVFDRMIEENSITPYYHSYVTGAVIELGHIKGIITEGKSGRNVIKAKVFIDATGDGDLAKYCNIPFDKENNENLQPVTLGFRVGGIDIERVREFTSKNWTQYQQLIKDLGISTAIGGWIDTLHKEEAWFNIAHIENIDATNSEDLTNAEIQGRKEIFLLMKNLKRYLPGFQNAYLIDTAPQMGIRDSRRIKGMYRFTKQDITAKFEDTIARAPDYTNSGAGSVEIPYRCLISDKCNNLIFAGRCISVDHELFNMFREIPCCIATGHAAGVAAAVTSYDVRRVDLEKVKNILIEQGALL